MQERKNQFIKLWIIYIKLTMVEEPGRRKI